MDEAVRPLDPRFTISEEQCRRMDMAIKEADPRIQTWIGQDDQGLWRMRWRRLPEGYTAGLRVVRRAAQLVGAPGMCQACYEHTERIDRPFGRNCLEVTFPFADDCGLEARELVNNRVYDT